MPAHPIDRLSVSVARGSTRRTFLTAVGAALGFTAIARTDVHAGDDPIFCSTDAECVSSGLVCTSLGICGFPECSPQGSGCASHDDCCLDLICTSGICSVSPRCALQGEGCSSNGDCCTGMICLSGICGIEPPAPPENTGGGNTGGGEGGGGNSGGGGNTGGGGYSGGGTTGTTTGGIYVSGLPSTGIAGESIRREKWGLAAAALAGAAGLLGLSRRSTDSAVDPTTDLLDQE